MERVDLQAFCYYKIYLNIGKISIHNDGKICKWSQSNTWKQNENILWKHNSSHITWKNLFFCLFCFPTSNKYKPNCTTCFCFLMTIIIVIATAATLLSIFPHNSKRSINNSNNYHYRNNNNNNRHKSQTQCWQFSRFTIPTQMKKWTRHICVSFFSTF